jgi:hypothetical protein
VVKQSRQSYQKIHRHNQAVMTRHQPYWWSQVCGLVGNCSQQVVVRIWQSSDLCGKVDDNIPSFYDP